MLGKVGALLGLAAIATLLAQALGLAYLASQGRLNKHTMAQIGAVLHGVDLLAQAKSREESAPVAAVSVDEVLRARALQSRQLELRAQNIEDRAAEAERLQLKLQQNLELYQQARQKFEQQLDDWERGEKAQALAITATLLGRMKPKQAQEQLMEMLKNKEMDAVLTLLKDMPVDKQSKIVAEFKEPEEVRLLADILRRLREGEPEAELANETRGRLEETPRGGGL